MIAVDREGRVVDISCAGDEFVAGRIPRIWIIRCEFSHHRSRSFVFRHVVCTQLNIDGRVVVVEILQRTQFVPSQERRSLAAEVVSLDQYRGGGFYFCARIGQDGEVRQPHRFAGRHGYIKSPLDVVAPVANYADAGRLNPIGVAEVVNDGRGTRTVGIVRADPLVGGLNHRIAVRRFPHDRFAV